jgi:hypothetical protein
MVIAAVDGTIRSRIVSYGSGNIFDLVHGVHAPATILGHADEAEDHESIDEIEGVEH